MAARRMPQMRLTISVAADNSAPVLPAETKAARPVLQQVQAHGQGGVLLLLEGGGRVVAHLYHLGGVDDLQPRGQFADAVLLEHLEDVLPPAHQNDFHAQLPHRGEGAPHVGDGRVVDAHGVYDDLHMFSSTFSVHSWINGNGGGRPAGRATTRIAPTYWGRPVFLLGWPFMAARFQSQGAGQGTPRQGRM